MPRKKEIVRDQQVYKLPYGATVTISYDVEHMPAFFQPGPGVVIVGEHVCTPEQSATQNHGTAIDRGFDARTHRTAPLRNFEVDENDPKYLAFKARLAARDSGESDRTSLGQEPAPPDLSPRVITNADLGKEFADRIKGETGIDIGDMPDPAGLVAAAK